MHEIDEGQSRFLDLMSDEPRHFRPKPDCKGSLSERHLYFVNAIERKKKVLRVISKSHGARG